MISENHWRVAEQTVDILYTEYSMAKGQSLINGVNIMFDTAFRRRLP
ncbi:putative glycosyl transferase [Mycobacteroides abscessus subsp. massiliense]|nr:putative glycosyl transferase [Mycobacteroides abscessus subsp. massiliense]